MSKAEINVDTIKDIILAIIKSGDYVLKNKKTLMSMSNLKEKSFYTRKHRLVPAKDYLESLTGSIRKGYCLIDLAALDRTFNANIDFIAVQARLTFWVQTEALPFLDRLMDRVNLLSFGERYQIPEGILKDVEGNKVSRSANITFKPLTLDRIEKNSIIGESVLCYIDCGMNITENLAIDGDVKLDIQLKVKDEDSTPTLFENIPANEKNIAHTSNTRPLTQGNLQTLGMSKTGKILAVSFNTYCPISDYGKALERLIAAYSTKDKKVLNEAIHVKATLPNGHIIEEDMVCTDAKISSNLTDPIIMSFVFNPKAKGV